MQPRVHHIEADQPQDQIMRLYTTGNPPPVMMVLAAPGTGKSTTITRTSEALISQSINIPNFLVLTFTTKTKRDLLSKFESIRTRNEEQKKKILSKVTNFHSLAWRYLGIKKNISQQAQQQFLKDTILELYPQSPIQKQLRLTSYRKIKQLLTEGKDDHAWQSQIQGLLSNHYQNQRLISPILQKYRDWMLDNYKLKSVTFDYALVKFREQLSKKQNKYLDNLKLLIIDEFQDSNPAQMKIVEQLMAKNRSNNIKVLMFGDFDQNIYTFRGASLTYIKQFLQKYDSMKRFLNNSYRLNNSVKNLSQKLITMNPQYNKLRSDLYSGYELKACNTANNNRTEVRKFQSQISEVRWVVDRIYEHLGNKIQMGDITILLRGYKNTLFYKKFKYQIQRRVKTGQRQIYYDYNTTYDIFKRQSIKYTMAIFKYFYERRQGKSVKQYITKICCEIDKIDIGDKLLKKYVTQNEIKRSSMFYPTSRYLAKLAKWAEFMNDFELFQTIIEQTQNNTFQQTFTTIYGMLKDAVWLPAVKDQNLKSSFREDNLNQFINSIEDFVELTDPRNPVFNIVEQLMNNKNQDDTDQQFKRDLKSFKKSNRVQIQTIHGAKGLEFQVVFLCGLNFQYVQENYRDQGSFKTPNQPALEHQNHKQFINYVQKANEELRLIYTAITRTSSFSYVTSSYKDNFSPSQNYYGQVREHPQFVYLKTQAEFYQYVWYDQVLDKQCYEYLLENGVVKKRANQPQVIANQPLFMGLVQNRAINERQTEIKKEPQVKEIKIEEEKTIKRQQHQE